MPDQTNFEARLSDAMRRYANRAPTEVDAMALAAEIASASTKETHRRPRWWPFGHNRQAHERSRTMLIATGATAALTIALAGGGLALLFSDPQEDTSPAVSPDALVSPLDGRVTHGPSYWAGYAPDVATDLLIDLGSDLDPAVQGRSLLQGRSIRITLPDTFETRGLAAGAPSECDALKSECNTGYLLQGWPDGYVPTTTDDYTVEMDGTHTFVFTASRDLVSSDGVPGIKQIHLLAPGFTNASGVAEILVEAETGPGGELESDTITIFPTTAERMVLRGVPAEMGGGTESANPMYQVVEAGQSPTWPWEFYAWDSEGNPWLGEIELRPRSGGTVAPDEPTRIEGGEVLDGGAIHDERYGIARWWMEGPAGASGATLSLESLGIVDTPGGDPASGFSIRFTAGDLPGRYVTVFDMGQEETALVVDVTRPPLQVRVEKASTSTDGYGLGQPTDVVLDLGTHRDPAVPGRRLKAGDSIRVTLPEEFTSSDLPVDVPSACDAAAGACNTGYLLQGWPQSHFPTTEDYYTLEMDGTHTFVFTATQDLGPSSGAPGIKQIHLMAPGFTNPDAMTEYLVRIEAETGPAGALESDTASFVPVTPYSFEPVSAFAGPGDGAAYANPVYQQARVGESPEWAWDFLVWPREENQWGGDIVMRPVPEFTGTTVPEGPTILDRGVFDNGTYENGGWWIEGPEGAVGATVTADPVDEVEAPISGQLVERLRIHFTAGDLPGRYAFHYGYSENEKMIVDVVE